MANPKKNKKHKKTDNKARKATILGAAFVAVVGGGLGGGLFALNRKGAKGQNKSTPKPNSKNVKKRKPPKS